MDEKERSTTQIILRSGFIGGAIALYLCAIGIVEAFSTRYLIGDILSLGQVMLVLGMVGAGIMAARELINKKIATSLGGSLLAGAITSVPLILLVIIIALFVMRPAVQGQVFNLREMFVNLSPGLVEILTFGQGLFPGIPLLILFSALMGGVGAAFVLLPPRWRLGLISGLVWTLGIGILSENVGQVLQNVGQVLQNVFGWGEALGRSMVRLLFANKALNPLAAAIIFVLAFAAGYFSVHEKALTRWDAMPAGRQKQGRVVGIVLLIGLIVMLPWILGLYLSQAFFMVGLFIMMGLGLNIVVGYAGLLDLGYVAFFAFGAYAMAVLTSTGPLGRGDFNFWTALPIAILVGVVWGLILGFPVLRMRGDYLAIVTLGFGEIIRILALSDWLAPLEGGAQGVLHIPNPQIFGIVLNTPQTMYYLVVLGSLLVGFVTIRLRDARLGRQWMAMREDEDVAEAMGINLIQTKLLAFAIGAAFSAMAGAIFAARLGTIFPHSFHLLISLNVLALIIVGGMGSIPGVVVGALVMVGLPELLREFTEYRLLMYGILLIVMMLVKPEGFLPEATRKRELHASEEAQYEQASAD